MPESTPPVAQVINLLEDDETFTVTDTEIGLVGGSPTVQYILRPISKAQIDALKEQHRTKEWNRKSRAYEYEFNQAAYDAALLDLALVDWVGVNRRGVKAECNRDNKQRLDPIRQQLIVTKATMNQVDDAVAEEAAESDSFRPADDVRHLVGRSTA